MNCPYCHRAEMVNGHCPRCHPVDTHNQFTITEEDRQLIILSLALCSKLRPGFMMACREAAKNLHGGSPEMFDQFRSFNPDVKPQDRP